MKLPRDVDAPSLIKALGKLGYEPTRQTGNHIRLTCTGPTPHSITVPDHSSIKAGTPSAISGDVAMHHRLPKCDLLELLFG